MVLLIFLAKGHLDKGNSTQFPYCIIKSMATVQIHVLCLYRMQIGSSNVK